MIGVRNQKNVTDTPRPQQAFHVGGFLASRVRAGAGQDPLRRDPELLSHMSPDAALGARCIGIVAGEDQERGEPFEIQIDAINGSTQRIVTQRTARGSATSCQHDDGIGGGNLWTHRDRFGEDVCHRRERGHDKQHDDAEPEQGRHPR